MRVTVSVSTIFFMSCIESQDASVASQEVFDAYVLFAYRHIYIAEGESPVQPFVQHRTARRHILTYQDE